MGIGTDEGYFSMLKNFVSSAQTLRNTTKFLLAQEVNSAHFLLIHSLVGKKYLRKPCRMANIVYVGEAELPNREADIAFACFCPVTFY